MAESPAVRTRAIHQFEVISSAVAVKPRCKLDLKAFEFNRLCTHSLGSSEENRTPIRRKNQKPPICIGGSEKLRAMDRPRYMNVPLPAPCHVNVAGVGKQSVWGLRIIACISVLTFT